MKTLPKKMEKEHAIKKMSIICLIAMAIIVAVISATGCQKTAHGLASDSARNFKALANKLEPMVDGADATNAELDAKWLMRYQAKQAAIANLNEME